MPELKSRLTSNKHKINAHRLKIREAVNDKDYDSAKELCQCAQTTYDDCVQMIQNVEGKIKSWTSTNRTQLQFKIDTSRQLMWRKKEDEIIASLPKPFPDELRVGIQKLLSIASMNEAFSDGHYGRTIDKVYGKAAPDELDKTKNELLAEMGL